MGSFRDGTVGGPKGWIQTEEGFETQIRFFLPYVKDYVKMGGAFQVGSYRKGEFNTIKIYCMKITNIQFKKSCFRTCKT